MRHPNKVINNAHLLADQVELKLKRIQELQDRVRVINHNPRFTDKQKEQHARNYLIEIDRSAKWLESAVKKERLAVAREYHRLRSMPGHSSNKELAALRKLSSKLVHTSQMLKLTTLTKAPTNDPNLDGLNRIKTPTTKPIMHKHQEDEFVHTAITKGWNKASSDMTKFAKANNLKVEEVKSQVVDTLLEKHFHQVFDSKPRDMSLEENQPKHRPS